MDLINLFDYERAAERILPGHLWDFIAGGATDEITTRRNRSAFEALALRPRYLRDVSSRDLSTAMLGAEISMPVFISPTGRQGAVHGEGEIATARGAERARTLMIVRSGDGLNIEATAQSVPGPRWLQLFHRGREQTKDLVSRAEKAGYRAICVTVDVPLMHTKERDLRNNYVPPFETVLDSRRTALPNPFVDPPGIQFTWNELEWLRGATHLPIVLKGINTAEDARLAVENGASAILVSTHGGRLFDTTVSSIESLPEVIDVVAGRIEVYLDSGIRRGSDIVKALALGATAVGIGRPMLWGLAVNGTNGVHHVLEILRAELDITLAYCGQTSVRRLEPKMLNIPYGWGVFRR